MDELPFTSNESFNDFVDRDETTEVVGFIEEVHAPKEIGVMKRYKLFKFVLSNGGTKRIACCIWGDELIKKYETEIRVNRILHITGDYTKAVQSNFLKQNNGFIPFEITIVPSTLIEFLGNHNQAEARVIDPIKVNFDNIANQQGTICIEGYLRETFRVVESRYGSMSYGSAAISNDQVKINLVVTNYTQLDLELGVKLTVTGEVSNTGGLTTITCKGVSGIVPDLEAEKMPLIILTKATKVPKRKEVTP